MLRPHAKTQTGRLTMKNINELLPTVNDFKRDISVIKETGTDAEGRAANVVNHLFNELMMIKTGWRAMFPSINAKTEPDKLKKAMAKLKQQFLKGLIENDISTIAQLEIGLKRARADNQDFFPSVGKFIDWCQPDLADMGLPTAFDAWRVISNIYSIHDVNWSKVHLAVHEAGKRCNFGDIKRGAVSEKQFCAVYKTVCDEVFKGATFELPGYGNYETKNRLTVDAKKEKRTKTEQNKSAAAKAMQGMGF